MADRLVVVAVAGVNAVGGIVLAVGAVALDIAFWKALVIAAIAAAVGAVGQTVGAIIYARWVKKAEEKLTHIQRAIGADKRATDRREP